MIVRPDNQSQSEHEQHGVYEDLRLCTIIDTEVLARHCERTFIKGSDIFQDAFRQLIRTNKVWTRVHL